MAKLWTFWDYTYLVGKISRSNFYFEWHLAKGVYIYIHWLFIARNCRHKGHEENQPTWSTKHHFFAFRQVKGSVLRKAGEPLNTLGYQALLGGEANGKLPNMHHGGEAIIHTPFDSYLTR